MTERKLQIEPEQVETFAKSAAEIATTALNGLSETARKSLADKMDQGSLYLHVQLHPAFLVVLAFDPSAENIPPIEIARWQGDAPEVVKRVLN